MTFAEKVHSLRTMKGFSQKELADAIGVTSRSVRNWESEGRFPKQHDLYNKLADVLGCTVEYLLSDEAEFVTKAEEEYGYRGRKSAEKLLAEINGLFAGGELAEEDMATFAMAVQEAYFDAKRKNKKKYGRKQEGGN